MDTIGSEISGGLRLEDDYFFAEPPEFEWVREGSSMRIFEENGAFALPRIGIEAEPWSWTNRRYNANAAFSDGRILFDAGLGEMVDPLDETGRPAILGAGPLRFPCIEPFRKWLVAFDGSAIDSHVSEQIARRVDTERRVSLTYRIELDMATPAFVQDNSPEKFFRMGKGEQRDGLSVGLGWRIEQMVRGRGELTVDGESRAIRVTGMRVKRRSIRTDGLFLRGHCWQGAVFPDGRAFGYLAYPPHEDGLDAWNRGFIYLDGRMYPAKAVTVPWLRTISGKGDDVTVELESELGTTRIQGRTTLSTFRLGNRDIWRLDLQQSGAVYHWDGQETPGMIERSATPDLTTIGT